MQVIINSVEEMLSYSSSLIVLWPETTRGKFAMQNVVHNIRKIADGEGITWVDLCIYTTTPKYPSAMDDWCPLLTEHNTEGNNPVCSLHSPPRFNSSTSASSTAKLLPGSHQ